jgi:cytochrome c biogenesis protein CcmG/thiol:disulfide interchange protein DsbE
LRRLSLLLPMLLAVLVTGRVPAQAPAQAPALDLAAYRGKVVLVDFWASWCAPCRESFPWMAEMRAKYGERGLVVVAVDVDEDAEDGARFLAKAGGDFVHVADPAGRLPEAYGVRVMPSSLVFDREGRPVYRHEGFRASDRAAYERHLVDVLEGRGPTAAIAPALPQRSRLGIHPWQRGTLAEAAMRLNADPLEAEVDDHIYFSKEASSGGRGFGGGGCGCN